MKPSPKLQNFGHRSRCEQTYHAAGVEGRSGGEGLQDAALPDAYGQSCGHEGRQMQENSLGDADGTLPYLLFMDEKKFDIQQVVNKQNDRVWAFSSSTE